MGKRLTEFEYEDRILKSLRRRKGVATAGDVAADTGLPLEETENALRQMLQVYQSHLDVDDEGNLLYRFEPGFKRRGDLKGWRWHQFKKRAWAVFTWIFKVWIMVMLVGYTAIFILLLLAFAIAGIAAASSSDSDSGGGSDFFFLPFYLILRILETVFWISLWTDSGGYGRRSRYGRRQMRRRREKPAEPLYKRIFRYVFGPEDESDPLAAERAFTAFVRERRGRVTAAEWSEKTGASLEAADRALTAAALRYRGEIDVSDDGILIYRFDDLRLTAEEGSGFERGPAPIWERPVTVPPLTGKNPASTNRWVTVFNGFNLLMAFFVLSGAVGAAGAAGTALTIGLGWVPLIFSALFFAIPATRALGRRRKVRAAAKENARRELVEAIYLSTGDGRARPVHANIFDTSKAGEDLVRDFEAEVHVDDEGAIFYRFPQVAAQQAAAESSREQATVDLVFGKTIFSSDEEEFSLEDAEMADFDRRLARELGGDVSLDFEMEWESVGASVESFRN